MAVVLGQDADLLVESQNGGTVTATANALIGATAIPVSALTMDLEAGTVLSFTGGKTATLTADAVQGATSLVVSALAAQINSTDTATVISVWSYINDMNKMGKKGNRDNQTFPVLMRTTPYSVGNPKESTYEMSGFLNPTDDGQKRLRYAERNNISVKFRVLFDGTNGFEQSARVTSYSYDVAPDGLQETGFELFATADATIIGTGPIL